jgi:hypothetical protein
MALPLALLLILIAGSLVYCALTIIASWLYVAVVPPEPTQKALAYPG